MSTAIKIVLYPFVALFFLLFFFLLLFPFDSLRGRVVQEAGRFLGPPYDIKIGSLSYFPPATLTLKEVMVGIKEEKAPAEKEPKGKPPVARFTRAKFRLQPVSLLWGDLRLEFDLEDKKGNVEGTVVDSKELTEVSVTLEKFDLSLVRILLSRWKIPIEGALSGDVVLELYKEDPLKNSGTIQLDVNSLRLGEMEIEEGLTLPPLSLVSSASGVSKIDIAVNRANWNVESLQLRGEDTELNLDGKIYGSRKIDNYRFNLKGSMKLNPALTEKIPLISLIESYKDANGLYPVTITGKVVSPNIRIGDFKVPLF